MLSSPEFSSHEEKYKDPSPPSLENLNQMKLPDDPVNVFSEEQRFDQVWLWVLLGLVNIGVFASLITTVGLAWPLLFSPLLMLATMVLMSSMRMLTNIDEEGIHYKLNPLMWKYRTIQWEEVDQIYVRQYSPIAEYGGWGIRYSFRNGKAFNIKGNQGIQIVLKSGKKILIGTQQPEEASRILSHRSLTV